MLLPAESMPAPVGYTCIGRGSATGGIEPVIHLRNIVGRGSTFGGRHAAVLHSELDRSSSVTSPPQGQGDSRSRETHHVLHTAQIGICSGEIVLLHIAGVRYAGEDRCKTHFIPGDFCQPAVGSSNHIHIASADNDMVRYVTSACTYQ